MGRIVHDAIVVTTTDFRPEGLPDIQAFRETLPEHFRQLVVGPIPAPLNGYVSYAFLPDGSKEGWGASGEGDGYRAQFASLFSPPLRGRLHARRDRRHSLRRRPPARAHRARRALHALTHHRLPARSRMTQGPGRAGEQPQGRPR